MPSTCEPRLTPREIQALRWFCEGFSTKEAAAKMGITYKTAVTHRTHLMSKAGVHDPIALFRWGVIEGYVPPLLPKQGGRVESGFAYSCTSCYPSLMRPQDTVLVMLRCDKHGLCWHRRLAQKARESAEAAAKTKRSDRA